MDFENNVNANKIWKFWNDMLENKMMQKFLISYS